MRYKLTASQRVALLELSNHRGWYESRYSPNGRHAYKDLTKLGFAEGDGHGKYRITDDGREFLDGGAEQKRTHPKTGARRMPPHGKESPQVQSAMGKRHSFGSTEKILRRNRKTWTRLGNKRRRAIDKKEAAE